MKKYLLRFTITHPGCNTDEVLTSKMTLKVVLDEDKCRERRSKLIDMRHFSSEDNIPCTAVTLYVESYEIKEKSFKSNIDNCFQFDSYKSINGEYFLHLYTWGKDTELQMAFPELLQ